MANSPATVYLVGSGPGDPDLLTRRAEQLIRKCDALVYDYLIAPEVIHWTKSGCEKHCVGKRAGFHSMPQAQIEALLVRLANEGKTTVRLKGGDPFVFGRGGEEMERLRAAGIPHEVVPAVTASLGAAAAVGLPLSHRNYNSAIVFITGHIDPATGEPGVDWEKYARLDATLCLYMAMKNLPGIVQQLLQAGLSPTTPAAVVQWATTSSQRECLAPLGKLVDKVRAEGLDSPAIVFIGRTVALAKCRSMPEGHVANGETSGQ